ncbi:MAG: hypothetical protein HOJ11_14660 [Gammaproteobacteria bacterium]|jgi:hypothetical protein|nr:hypothetical protein [Gammaproteobacteria bacterium]MBT5686244.1 hypothetical protein [Gammaproteobacteria bacterium]MDG1232725.1 hypothetical protein [Pseudomonadales bacterium]
MILVQRVARVALVRFSSPLLSSGVARPEVSSEQRIDALVNFVLAGFGQPQSMSDSRKGDLIG